MNLLDLGVVTAADVVEVEGAVSTLLRTTSDVLLIQAEAIVALEATARSLGRPGLRALNVVTGPYGALFGRWLSAAGADVVNLRVPYHRSVTVDEVESALNRDRVDLVAVVHAEAATGGLNPVDQIAAAVQTYGALLVVDAVASVGAHPVTPDSWPADVVVIGGQKALAGPAGVSALSISDRAWLAMERNPGAPRESILSLLDLREGWLRSDRTAVPGTPSSLETAALRQALTRVAAEGVDLVIDRHRAAAAAARAGVRELGLQPWIADDAAAATVVTTVATPAGRQVADMVAAGRAAGARLLGAAPGSLAATTLRFNHTGRAADLPPILLDLTAVGTALRRGSDTAVAAARKAWKAVLPC